MADQSQSRLLRGTFVVNLRPKHGPHNFDGFDFWLAKLDQFGDYRRAEMVRLHEFHGVS
jgi:hypothetical protein